MVGDGPLEGTLRDMVATSQVGDVMHLLGWLTDNVSVYFGSDIVLLPSLWEGLPRTLIEAQAAGLPSVASNIKGNREVVTPDTGFLCNPRDAADYAVALGRLMNSSSLRDRMGAAARRHAEAYFDSKINSAAIIAQYRRLLYAKGIRVPKQETCSSPVRGEESFVPL